MLLLSNFRRICWKSHTPAFVIEARRADGKLYPGSTIKNILAALYRVMKENLGPRHVVNFIEKASREQTYPQLQNALDRHNGKNFC